MIFALDEKQKEKLREWWSNHPCSNSYGGAIGGSLTYQFTPTNLGTVAKAKCGHAKCSAEIDLTEYSDW